jgi:hypothetical protein
MHIHVPQNNNCIPNTVLVVILIFETDKISNTIYIHLLTRNFVHCLFGVYHS